MTVTTLTIHLNSNRPMQALQWKQEQTRLYKVLKLNLLKGIVTALPVRGTCATKKSAI